MSNPSYSTVYKMYLDGMTLEDIQTIYPQLTLRDIDYMISAVEERLEKRIKLKGDYIYA